jgi:hypothetical protein
MVHITACGQRATGTVAPKARITNDVGLRLVFAAD